MNGDNPTLALITLLAIALGSSLVIWLALWAADYLEWKANRKDRRR